MSTTLKDRFKLIRSYFNLSQAQFAQRIHKSPGYVSLVETGRIHVSDESIDIICSEFPINKVWLMNGSENMFATGHSVPAVNIDTAGDRVKEVRRIRNLSQSGLAKLIDCSAIHISFVEVGRVKPSNDLLNRISLKCEINEQWLLSGVGDPEDIDTESKVDDELIGWLNDHPEIVLELRNRKRFGGCKGQG